MRDLAAREAEVTEDDVFDAGREEVAALGDGDLGILVEQVEDHGQVVHAERPERVLVRAHDPEVLPVAVDAEHFAELARVDQFLQLQHAGVVEQQVARHQDEVACVGERDELVHLGRVHRGRLLHHHVLAGFERALCERVMRGDRRRDDDRVDGVVGQRFVEVARDLCVGIPRGEALAELGVDVDEPGKLGEIVEVADEVRAPVAEAGHCDFRHSFQTLPSTSCPLVAFRKSTITLPRRTTSP